MYGQRYAASARTNSEVLEKWEEGFDVVYTTRQYVVFLGGMQLMVLGIIGMHLGKLFMQTRQRPKYIARFSNLVKI